MLNSCLQPNPGAVLPKARIFIIPGIIVALGLLAIPKLKSKRPAGNPGGAPVAQGAPAPAQSQAGDQSKAKGMGGSVNGGAGPGRQGGGPTAGAAGAGGAA